MSFKPRTYGSAPNVTILPHFLSICHYLCWLSLFGLKLSWRLSAKLTLTVTRHIHSIFYTWHTPNIVFANAMDWRCWVVLWLVYSRKDKSNSSLFLRIYFHHLADFFRKSYTSNTKWNGRNCIFNFFLPNIELCKIGSKYSGVRSAFWKCFSFSWMWRPCTP